MMKQADKSKDGKIAWHEFLELMIGQGQQAIDEFVEETQHSHYSPTNSRTGSNKTPTKNHGFEFNKKETNNRTKSLETQTLVVLDSQPIEIKSVSAVFDSSAHKILLNDEESKNVNNNDIKSTT